MLVFAVRTIENGGGAAPEQLVVLQMMRRLNVFVFEIDKNNHCGCGSCCYSTMSLSVEKKEDEDDKNTVKGRNEIVVSGS